VRPKAAQARAEEAPLRVGDLVICAKASFRDEARLGLDVGIYVAGRSRDALVYFARPDRSLWIPLRFLRGIDPADPRVVAPPGWTLRLHAAVRKLDATDLELERREDSGFDAKIGCPGFDLPLLREIEALAGDEAGELRVRAGSMSRVLVVFPVGREARGPARTASGSPGPVAADVPADD
jgi:hypothetical protein